VGLPLLRLQQLLLALVLGQTSPNGAGLLWSEVERQVLLALVEQAELRSLVGVDDSEDSGDRLSEVVAIDRAVSAAACSWLTNSRSILPSFPW
jgi:hypothetical protein